MLSLISVDVTCAVCGQSTKFDRTTSSSGSGLPDLDFRPGYPTGFALSNFVMECPHCRYAAENIQKPLGLSRLFLWSPSYLTYAGLRPPAHSLAAAAIRMSLIAKKQGRHLETAKGLLLAAWQQDDAAIQLDDRKTAKQAEQYRIAALRALRLYHPPKQTEQETTILLRADLLRRTRQFDILLRELKEAQITDRYYGILKEYQQHLALQQDAARHNGQEAVKWYDKQTV